MKGYAYERIDPAEDEALQEDLQLRVKKAFKINLVSPSVIYQSEPVEEGQHPEQ